MINLQQYYLEELLVERCAAAGVEIRWKNKVTAVEQKADGAVLTVETPDGGYVIACDWLIDLGPEGGTEGGYLLFAGPPHELAKQAENATGHFLKTANSDLCLF
jgi:hypothetical protein